MSGLLDIARHPFVRARNARWKAGRFLGAFRKTFFDAPAWVRACCRRQETAPYGPLNIFLEAASACNLHCPMCPTGAGLVTRKHGTLKLDLARKLAAEIRHRPEQVGLWLGGEPLLNGDLPEIIGVLAAKGLPVAIHTNGALLTRDLSSALIQAGLSMISFSFDGPDADTYQRMRRGGDYGKVVENIREFLRVKEEMKAAPPAYIGPACGGPAVVIQTLIPYQNEEKHPYGAQVETPEAVKRLFDGLAVDEFRALLANSWSGTLEGAPMVAPNRKQIGQRMPCRIPYTDLTIAWNGDAVTCCGDLDADNVMGNLYEENLYELWNNAAFRRFRRDMHTKEIEAYPLCGACERLWAQPHWSDYELRLFLLRHRLRI